MYQCMCMYVVGCRNALLGWITTPAAVVLAVTVIKRYLAGAERMSCADSRIWIEFNNVGYDLTVFDIQPRLVG